MANVTPLHILLVDDSEEELTPLAKLLRLSGHTVFTATSVRSALRTAADNPCDVLVSDLGLPDGSGLDLMRELTARRAVPGIALTGFGEDRQRETRQAGFARHLVKPVVFDELLASIQQVIGESRPAMAALTTSDLPDRM